MTCSPVFHALPDATSATLFLIGEFDMDGVDDFNRGFDLLTLLGPPRVAIDMSDLMYLGSAGIGCLVRAHRGPVHVVLQGVRPPQRRVLEVTALDSYFDFVDGEVGIRELAN